MDLPIFNLKQAKLMEILLTYTYNHNNNNLLLHQLQPEADVIQAQTNYF